MLFTFLLLNILYGEGQRPHSLSKPVLEPVCKQFVEMQLNNELISQIFDFCIEHHLIFKRMTVINGAHRNILIS